MAKSRLLGLILVMAIPAITTYAQNASIKPRSDNKLAVAKDGTAANSSAVEVAVKPATDDSNYIIGPDDELIVSVWKEPEISRTVPVRPDGKISLALLNDVQATGLTPMQLGSDITGKLKKFISEPQVTVIVTKINSQRIFIVGEVPRTGAYTLLPNMTVLDALSSASGFTPFAKRTKIYILRKESGKLTRIPFNYKEAVAGRRPEQDIALKPGDRIVVP
jgi:polysaccharide export outer membrane protein